MFDELWNELGITGWDVVALVIDATVLFWVFTLLMGFFGQQMRARVTITSFALMTVIGSVTARTMLGSRPTMVAGILVLLVLFLWEGFFHIVGSHLPHRLLPTRQPRVVLKDGVIDVAALKKAHLRPADLKVRLRRKGVTSLRDIALAIIEADGSITVIRVNQVVEEEMLADVAGL